MLFSGRSRCRHPLASGHWDHHSLSLSPFPPLVAVTDLEAKPQDILDESVELKSHSPPHMVLGQEGRFAATVSRV